MFYEHHTAGHFVITHAEYERIPAVVFDGLAIFKRIYEQYRQQQARQNQTEE
jgi:hypothetical protein